MLFQNPDLVMVHYLNVPLRDDGKHTIPSLPLGTLEPGRWTREELMNEIRPMCMSFLYMHVPRYAAVDDFMRLKITLEKKNDYRMLNCKFPFS